MSRLHRALLLFGQPTPAPRETIYRRRRIAAAGFLLGVALGVLLATGHLSCGGPAEAQAVVVGEDAAAEPPALEPLPEDFFQRCAVKALRGEFGVLPRWKRDAYLWGRCRGVTVCGVAKVTSYGPWESPEMSGGQWTASGTHVSEDECAANPEIPFGAIVWTAAYGLRRVEDRGGWVKVGYAVVRGRRKLVTCAEESANFDYYALRELPTVRRSPWARVKY